MFGKKMLTVMVLSTFLLLGLCSLGLAQTAQVLKDSHKMMQDAWKMFDSGQRMVIQGVEMNKQVAAQAGFASQMAQGDKIIQDGRNTIFQGAQLFAQGEQTIMNNPNTTSVVKQGIDMLRQGFKMALGGKDMISQGVAMDKQVAQSKGAAGQFAQGDQIINTGMGTMADAAKLFMQGEALYLGNK
jgi:hypothetical protein